MMEKYKICRDLAKVKRDTVKDELKFMRHDNLTVQEKKLIEEKELVLKQSDTDIALIYENLVQMKHDQKILQRMHPEDPELRTVRDRIAAYEEENEMLFNRLERWLYPYYTFVGEDEQEEAIKYLDSVEWQRALHQAIKPI